MSNLKIEGKVGDFCLNCKNCKAVTRIHDGKNASIRIIEVDCEDPYDGMVKTLDVDSDICCSMFEVRKEKEPFNLNMPREAIKAIAKLNNIISELEKEKSDHLKGIERLKKSQEKLQNQVKNLQTTNEESYKREEKLEDKCHKLERRLLDENKRFDRLDTEFLIPLARVLYPREAKICKPYSEVLKDIKLLNNGVYDLEEDNKRLAEKNKELRDNCHKAEADVTTLNSKVETLKNKNDKYLKKITDQQAIHYKQCARILELECMVNKLQSGEYDDILAKDIEIKSLQAKYEDAMSGWNHTMESHDGLIDETDKLKNENTSLNTINKGLAEDRKKLINYIRSLKIASENYLKEFTYEED